MDLNSINIIPMFEDFENNTDDTNLKMLNTNILISFEAEIYKNLFFYFRKSKNKSLNSDAYLDFKDNIETHKDVGLMNGKVIFINIFNICKYINSLKDSDVSEMSLNQEFNSLLSNTPIKIKESKFNDDENIYYLQFSFDLPHDKIIDINIEYFYNSVQKITIL